MATLTSAAPLLLTTTVDAVGGDGCTLAPTTAPDRIMGRRGGSVPLTGRPPPVPLLVCFLVLLGWCVGVEAAARLPGGGRLAPGPSVEDDNPLPPVTHAAGPGQQSAPAAATQQRRCAALSTRVLRQVLGPAYNPAYMAFSLEDPPGAHLSRGGDPRDPRGTEPDGGAADLKYSGRVLKESLWTLDVPGSSSAFAVDEDYQQVLSDAPAWQVRYEMPTILVSGDLGGGGGGGGDYNYRTSAGRWPREHVPEEGGEDSGAARAGRAAWGGMALPFGAVSKDMQWHCESPLRWVDLGPDYFPRFLRSADCGHHTCTGAGFVCRPRSFSVKVLRRREGACAPADDLPREESTVGLPSDLRDLWVWELRAVNFCCVCSLRV